MGDAISPDRPAPTGDDEAARERRRLVWIAVVAAVAVTAALVLVGVVAGPGSSSSGSSVSVVPSPDASDGGDLGFPDDAGCSVEQSEVLGEVEAALPWPTTVTDMGGITQDEDGTCLGLAFSVATPYDEVVAALPDALAQAGIQVTQDAGTDAGTTFTGTSFSGQSLGLFVADDQGVGTVIGVSVPLMEAEGSG